MSKNDFRTWNTVFGHCTAEDTNRYIAEGRFAAIESRVLRYFMTTVMVNVHIDFHGWENSVIGDEVIGSIALEDFGLKYDKWGLYGTADRMIFTLGCTIRLVLAVCLSSMTHHPQCRT